MSSARTMDAKLHEPEGPGEENSGKKKSKFKSIKKFFGKRKRKETLSPSESGSLKPCQSASDVTASQTMHIDYDSEDELERHRSSMGSRALSHDSIFIPEASQESTGPVRVFSQENVSDRIRALQLKLQQNWKSGLPSPFGIPSKRIDDAGMNSEDDGLPRSPPETSLLHEILNSSTAKFSDSHKHLSSLSLAGTGSEEEEQVTSENQLIPQQPNAKIIALRTSDCSFLPPADFDTPPEFSSCLDNSAAKHKLLVKPRNQRSSRTRRPPSRNLSTSRNDLSSTLEQDESDAKELVAELTDEREELAESQSETPYVQLPEMSKDLHQKLTPQDGKVCMLPCTAELDLLLYENNAEDCQIMQQLPQMVPLSLPSHSKEDIASLYLTPNQEKEQSEPLEMSSGDVSDMSQSLLKQEDKQIYDISSKADMLSDRNVTAQNDVIPSFDGTKKMALRDSKTLVENICNEEIIKRSPSFTNSINHSPKNTFHSTYLPYHEDKSISQTSCTVSPQIDRPSSLTPSAMKQIQEQFESGKETHHTPITSGLVLDEKEEKEDSELYGLRKFSVSSARGRPRTSSLNMKETLERETPVATQALRMRTKKSSSNENVAVEVSCLQEKKRCTKILASQPESELEMVDAVTVTSQSPSVGSKPVLSKSSVGLPSQSSVNQSSCEDKNPFHVKLRSTSLSLKHRDDLSQESKETKRHSAEFSLEKEVLPVSPLKSEKAEFRKTTDVNINSFLNDGLKMKPEQGATKPPLRRKPVLQHFIIGGTNTINEKQEKVTKYPELKNEDKDLEKKQSPPEVPEKSVPSNGTFVDVPRITESQTVPAWITIAKQKQRAIEQELNKEEKPVVQEEKTDAEKQMQENERVEEAVRQQADFTQSPLLPFPPTVSSEKQKKETKLDIQESLPRASMLSHQSPVQSSVVPTEKEDIKPLKKISHQPSWMELAKKKSQAWSDMPQRIK
ncbi:CRACD-like protein [Sceloporus undulatus]|uniref:CRACD-like protein n=1 Tax=Sceloporus undulatus TaxID=8520 RepID=UPI001C4CF627|nr:CRACD-like protein [Sceloporus undulatus]XP_042311968.1 CRACD-like protein [Sceloporus undulatus]XP_042311969.1 CRACD-like protein [Sceloporus undulatus]